MSDKQNNIGEQMKYAVQEALEAGDFKKLNDMVSGTVTGAIEEARRQIANAARGSSTGSGSSQRNTGGYQSGARNSWQNSYWNEGQSHRKKGTFHYNKVSAYGQQSYPAKKGGYGQSSFSQPVAQTVNQLPLVKIRKAGSVSSVLYMVFGGIGVGLCGIALFIELMSLMAFSLGELVLPLLITSAIMLIFINMIQRGIVKRERLKRAERYVQLGGGKPYINIADIALHTGKSKKAVRKDIKKMLAKGIFPEGHLDPKETCLMLTDTAYSQYVTLEKEKKALELQEKVERMKEKQAGVQTAEEGMYAGSGLFGTRKEEAEETAPESGDPELDALVKEGQECIRKLQESNAQIEGEVISSKLYQLEKLLKEIFERVQEHPEQLGRMRKFMEYYLPTTLKLVDAYAEFDSVSVQGEEILAAKTEIENTLDTINGAFAELLNKLFRDTVYDVTADAKVLQTMLAQEGLTKDTEFVFQKKQEG